MKTLKVYIADDHNIVSKGIAEIISKIPEVSKTEVFHNGKLLFDACCHEIPDVVLLDLNMPEWDGRKTLSELKNTFPELRCYILSMYNEREIIDDCIQKGASGYLNKDCTKEELFEAVKNIEVPYFSKEVLKHLSGYGKENSEVSLQKKQLTEKEVEVLKLLCEGLTPKEIAEKMYVSHRTVETHKLSVMQKFEVSSVGKLISIALKNNMV